MSKKIIEITSIKELLEMSSVSGGAVAGHTGGRKQTRHKYPHHRRPKVKSSLIILSHQEKI